MWEKVFRFTLKTPAVHTINVKKEGKKGAKISMNMAVSLRTSANSLVVENRKTIRMQSVIHKTGAFSCVPPFFSLRVQLTPEKQTGNLRNKTLNPRVKAGIKLYPFCQAKRILPNIPVPSAGKHKTFRMHIKY